MPIQQLSFASAEVAGQNAQITNASTSGLKRTRGHLLHPRRRGEGILSSLYEDGEDVDSDGESSGSYRHQSKSKTQTKQRSSGSVVSNRRRHCPPPQESVDDKDNEKAVDVWDKPWVRDATLDERQKSTIYAGFGLYSSIAEEWERQRQLDRPVDNGNSLWCRLYCDLCSRPEVEQW